MTAAAYRTPQHRYDALDLRADAHLLDLRNRVEPHDPAWDAQPRVQGARVSTYAPVVREETTLGALTAALTGRHLCRYCGTAIIDPALWDDGIHGSCAVFEGHEQDRRQAE